MTETRRPIIEPWAKASETRRTTARFGLRVSWPRLVPAALRSVGKDPESCDPACFGTVLVSDSLTCRSTGLDLTETTRYGVRQSHLVGALRPGLLILTPLILRALISYRAPSTYSWRTVAALHFSRDVYPFAFNLTSRLPAHSHQQPRCTRDALATVIRNMHRTLRDSHHPS